jgi:hypothetical protein
MGRRGSGVLVGQDSERDGNPERRWRGVGDDGEILRKVVQEWEKEGKRQGVLRFGHDQFVNSSLVL